MSCKPVELEGQAIKLGQICDCLDPNCEECSTRELSRSLMAEIMFPGDGLDQEWLNHNDMATTLFGDILFGANPASLDDIEELVRLGEDIKSSPVCAPWANGTTYSGSKFFKNEKVASFRQDGVMPYSGKTNESHPSIENTPALIGDAFHTSNPRAPMLKETVGVIQTEQYLDHNMFPALFPLAQAPKQAFSLRSEKKKFHGGRKRSRQQPDGSVRGKFAGSGRDTKKVMTLQNGLENQNSSSCGSKDEF